MMKPSIIRNDRMAKRSSFGEIVRRTLGDITNSVPQHQQQSKSLPPVAEKKLMVPSDPAVKEYIDNLLKENMALARLITDKNKIIELTGTELQKMKLDLQKMQVNLQKMQLQNWNLAQSNSHLLAELNLGKDRLKVLQHEALCKEAVLKAKSEELKEKSKIEKTLMDLSQKEENAVDEQVANDCAKIRKARRGKSRSQSMGPSTTSQPVVEKETSENKRRCLRRQSARLKPQEQEPAENLFEIEDTQFLGGDFPVTKGTPNSSAKKEDENENHVLKSDVYQPQRTSLGRPSRRAAANVQSYKERSLNTKLRRSE